MYCSTLCPAALSCFPFFALFLMFSLVIQFSSDLLYVMLFCVVLCCVVLCCAVLCLRTTVLTLRCSWSWAWCWRVNFSCCFWNSLISSCFWICCCFWMRSSSCCSCLSHSPGSEPGPSILRSVRRSKGDKGSTANGTSGLISTVAQKQQSKKRFVSPNCTLNNSSRNQRRLCAIYKES